jgi:hypothetical protein
MKPSADSLSPDEAPLLHELVECELHRVEHALMAFLHVDRVGGSLGSGALEVDRLEDVDENTHGQGEERRRPHGEPPRYGHSDRKDVRAQEPMCTQKA